ncbi:MAG: CRTAC1 family protein [Fuerstiella sp.]
MFFVSATSQNDRRPRYLRSRRLLILVATVGFVHLSSLHRLQAALPAAADAIQFVDVTDASGIQFVHNSPFTPERHTHLTFGSGTGWIDIDHDGRPDLFAAQGVPFVPQESPNLKGGSDSLYRNEGSGRFRDISSLCGLNDNDYSMGVSVGDFNNDGFQDIYVTNFGRNRLLENNGDGTFTETAVSADVADAGFGSSCTWVDLNNDGNLDLFVVNYVDIDPAQYKLCTLEHNGRSYGITCHPRTLSPTCDVVFQSRGDGRFMDNSLQAGLHHGTAAQGLGVVAADLDADGDTDIYVANDSVANHLWFNQGGSRLTDEAVSSGTAFNRSGQREAGMGTVVGDVDGDGRPDLFVTNYYGETNTLYRNETEGYFLDVTDEFGLGSSSRLRLGFGTSLFDFDNDGWLDLFVANGHVHDLPAELGRDEPFAQRPQLFQNQTGKRFRDVSDSAGPYFNRHLVGRSCAVADYDGDGLQDLAVGHLNSGLVLLHNQQDGSGTNSLRLELVGVQSNRSAIGAVIEVFIGNRKLTRFRVGSSGYLSCDDACLTIGIGDFKGPVDVTVQWPGGMREDFPDLQTGQTNVLIEGRQTDKR